MLHSPILKAGIELSKIPIYDDLMIDWQLMGANEFKVDIELPGKLIAPISSQIIYKGRPYVINTAPSVQKLGVRKFRYSVVFEYAPLYRLYDKKLRHLGNRTFQYYGKPAKFAELIVSNINEIDPGWTVGPCEDMDEKTINFAGHTCRTALDLIAETFKIEWDVPGKTISFLKQVGTTTPYVFKYGMGNGLYSLAYQYQNDKNIVTRAYGYGSTKNLPENYRSGATQLMFNEVSLENNVNLYGIKEGDYENEDIYPEVIGTISDAPAWVPDSAIFYVSDDRLDFDLNTYKSINIPKLSFKTGQLQGQNFEIIDFNNTTKTYKLKVFQDSNNNTLPNTVFKAQPGDTYTLFDMPLPNERVVAAEAKLKAATQEWLNTNSVPQVLYSLELDPLYARDNNIMLKPGDRVRIQDEDLGIDELIRVTKVNYPFNFPEVITPSTKIVVEIANFVPYTTTERVLSDIIDTKHEVKTVISDSNFQKRLAERVKSMTGVDYLPAGTLRMINEEGYIEANLINADYIVTRNLITGKVKITALNNNIVFEDDEQRAIMMIDDTGSLDGIQMKNQPPIDGPNGKPDPDFLFAKSVEINGASVLRYFYAVRGPGFRVGLSPLNSAGFSSVGRPGIYTNGKVEASYNDQGIRFDKDGFTANGNRTKTGHVILENKVNTYKVLNVVNGLVMGVIESLPIADYTPLVTDPINPLPSNDTDDTGYDPESSIPGGGDGTVDPPIEEPIDPPAEPPAGSPTTLLEAGFPLGFMIKSGTLNNANNRASLIAHAVGITPENDYKNVVKSFDPATGAYTTDFSETDPQIIWAKANGKKFHVHTGHWPNHTESWEAALENNPLMTTQKWWDLLKIKIQAPLLHLKNDPALDGVADSYDVLNEIFLNSNDTASGTLRYKEDVYLRKLGPGYFRQAMIWAREADPRIKLFVNEVNFEYGGYKVENMLAFAGESKTENFPLDGWGLQYHQNCKISSTPTSGTRKNLKLLADTVDHIHLSEVALSLRYNPYYVSGQPFVFTPEMELLQAQKYLALMRYFVLDIPKAKQYRFTTWGIIDPDYMGADEEEFAMLLKADHSRKLAYDYMLNEMIQINSQQELPL